MKSATLHSRRVNERGVALLEALVGILIFAIGILGLVGLQASMTKAQTAGKIRSEATNLTNDLFSIIQTDHRDNMPQYASDSCAGYERCNEWLQKVKAALPAANPTVAVNNASGSVSATLSWTQPGEEGHQFTSSMSWQQ